MVFIAAFYKFVSLPDFREKRGPLWAACQQHHLRGTILLAEEGINGTVAGEAQGVQAVLDFLRRDERLKDLVCRGAESDRPPFQRLKVKLKREIVTLGQPQVNPGDKNGTYVEPEAWNQLICDPDVLVIDTRNEFEVAIGSFRGAVSPQTRAFREFPDYVHRQLLPQKPSKIAMFCTGGIRCEKASAYLLQQGVQEVYHLRGGILNYLDKVPPSQSLWEGECFVFDERVAVQQGLKPGHADQGQPKPGSYGLCQSCGYPVLRPNRQPELSKQQPALYVPNLSCPRCNSPGA